MSGLDDKDRLAEEVETVAGGGQARSEAQGSPERAEPAAKDDGLPVERENEVAGTADAALEHAEPVSGSSGVAVTGLGLNDVPTKPSGIIERDLETAPTLLPAPPLSPHPADELHAPDSPTTSLIAVLRDQLRLLSDQSSELNAKLVASISKHADLLDTHEALTMQHADLTKKADALAQDKRQWEESMKTGLLVERSQITLEMQRLASGLVEEERRRGSAEERRRKVEDEVDELAASLFDQANTMVAQERHGRIEAEERLKSTEENLFAAEALMRDMQTRLQSMPAPSAGLSDVPRTAARSARTDGEGVGTGIVRRHLSSHVPYTEYTSFLAHLRSLRPLRESSKALFPPPLLSALASQAFLTRITVEDHEPTLRLEAAPDLSWLSRRSVTAAILSGDLIIEPVPASQILQGSTGLDVGCAMCGKPVFPGAPPHSHFGGPLSPGGAASHFGPPPQHPNRSSSGGRFSLKPFFNANATSPSTAASPNQSPLASPAPGKDYESSSMPATTTTSSALPAVYIFRVAKSTAGTGSSDAANAAKAYPLCRSGWCLERLRATCELWHFIRAGLVGIVWAGDDGYVLATEAAAAQNKRQSQITVAASPAAQTDDARAAKRASAPAASELGASPAASTLVAGAGEAEPPRRKSGWGLGFKWKSTTKEGSSVASSVAASPPGSPRRLPPPIAEKEERPSSGLGAPLELEGKEALELPPRKSIEQQVESVREGQNEDKVEIVNEQEARKSTDENQDTLSVRPGLSRQASDLSFASAHETFATASVAGTAHSPEIADAEVVDSTQPQQASAEANEKRSIKGDSEAADLASPVQATDDSIPGSSQIVHNQAGDDTSEHATSEVAKPAPPPVPRRAAGRPKSVIIAREGRDSAAPSPRPEDDDDVEKDQVDSPMANEDTAPAAEKAAPPLPARPPKTPQLHLQPSSASRTPTIPDGEKAFLPIPSPASRDGDTGSAGQAGEEETWEAKTWRQIVKLREAMWRARVGVVDEAE